MLAMNALSDQGSVVGPTVASILVRAGGRRMMLPVQIGSVSHVRPGVCCPGVTIRHVNDSLSKRYLSVRPGAGPALVGPA